MFAQEKQQISPYLLKPNTMKNNLLSLVAIFAIALSSNAIIAQTSATVTGTTAGARLIKPMGLSETTALHFGTINVLNTTGGTVTLPSNSTTRVFSANVAGSSINPQPSNAAYSVSGTKNTTYALTLPSTIAVTDAVSSEVMTISTLTARFNGASADAVTSTLSNTGTDSFTVGGLLTVGSNQGAGAYAGAFNVSVDYN